MTSSVVGYTEVRSIVGDVITVVASTRTDGHSPTRLGDLARVHEGNGVSSLAQVIRIDGDEVALQVFGGTRGVSRAARTEFLNEPLRATYSRNILGRVFGGAGATIDGGPSLRDEPAVEIAGPTINPMRRALASKMIRTDIPMIDVFNCLVESQKIPIFAAAGEPYNPLLARIGIQAEADVVVFGGMGLIFDDYHFFREQFEDAGVFGRTVMFVNQASDPIVERLQIPDLALAVAERFAVEQSKRVLVLLTDMTSYADAMKELGIAMDQIPANRGYMGDLYSKLAKRYEKACDFAAAGSVTILSVTTMPGDDVTHPVPDNTGYITEGQFYLRDGMIDPFGSLSRLKQHVVGKETRDDHGQLMSSMIRFYAGSRDAEQKKAMAFELSEFDQRLLRFGELFRERFMKIDVAVPLESALDTCWQTLSECFRAEELLMKRELVQKYFPEPSDSDATHPAD
ncbi:MAG: V-type ATP synthase subunit B [Myxococcota bacterium]